MSGFIPNTLVYSKIDRNKYGIGIIRNDHATTDPDCKTYVVVYWSYPYGTGNGLVHCERKTDLKIISFSELTNPTERQWALKHMELKFSKINIKSEQKKEELVNDSVNDPETFRKNMKKLDRQIRQVKKTRMKWVNAELDLFRILFKKMDCIEVPSNDEEVEAMRFYIQKYDESIEKIEKEFISKFRRYVEEK